MILPQSKKEGGEDREEKEGGGRDGQAGGWGEVEEASARGQHDLTKNSLALLACFSDYD